MQREFYVNPERFQTSSELKTQALACLKGNWIVAIFACLIVSFIPALLNVVPVVGTLVNIFILGPLEIGAAYFFLSYLRNWGTSLNNLFKGFASERFAGNFLLWLLVTVYTFLWALLLIVPGIIKSYSYAMAFYIKCDNPALSAGEAINASMKMMAGHKKRLFFLDLSFLGWILLSILTCGLGFLLLAPYYHATIAAFYLDLKGPDVEALPPV